MADTRIITESEPAPAGSGSHSGRNRRPAYRGPVVAAALLGGLLCVLGVPRLIAAFGTLDARDVLWSVYNGADVDDAALLKAAASIERAGHWAFDSELESERGLLLLHAAEAETGAERTALLAQAEAATVAGVAAGPSQPSAWLRLAYLREQHGDANGALRALRMSFLSGAVAPAIMVSRIELALRLPQPLPSEMTALLRRQIALTWVVSPDYITELSTRPEAAALVQAGLNELGPAEIESYSRLYGVR